ncbi:YciI family protein [Jannaschia donghaensis]|uniref:YciI-like protein n=1 Tax=Jannaschia donghaensis TaxID=420998 RepID=A0A0M6YJ39_9RHOB|nr:YciI family protein [Jannaschia donghaensis]CTQ49675.1 YciI-like protein [Jannaschia donghaensis]
MLHALICTDKPDHLEVRKTNREAHLAHLKADPHVIQAGPFINAAGEMSGSLIIFDTPDRAHVEAFAAADPYARAGLFDDVRIETWNRVIGA